MKKIALKLIDNGIAFDYEHNGSNGEKIQSYELGFVVSTCREGFLYFDYEGELERFEINDKYYDYLVCKIDEIIVEATT